MATVTVQLTGICAGGNHLTFTVTGDVADTIQSTTYDIVEELTEDERRHFVKALCKLVKKGKTNAQAKAALQAGVVISV